MDRLWVFRVFSRAVVVVATFVVAFPVGAADYTWPVVRVIDGDTVVVDASADLPPERAAGQAAAAFTRAAVSSARSVVIQDPAWGKWGGRVIADLVLGGRRGSWCR